MKKTAPNTNIFVVSSAKAKPEFGEMPVFVYNPIQRGSTVRYSTFGQMTIQSNLSSFEKLCSDTRKKTKFQSQTLSYSLGNLHVKKAVLTSPSNVPDILHALGLAKKCRYAPKCYKKKNLIVKLSEIDSSTLDKIDFEKCNFYGFGELSHCWW